MIDYTCDVIAPCLALSDLARNALCVMATSAASERVFSMARYVVNSRRANVKSSSVNDILFFNSAFKAKNGALEVVQKASHYYLTVFFKNFCWL